MGGILGVLAKSKGQLIRETPLFAEEESWYSLANIFLDSGEYVERVLSRVSTLSDGRKDWLRLTAQEIVALRYNNIEDCAEGEINYRKSVNEPLKPDFHAIGMVFDESKGTSVYSPKYLELENWAKTELLWEALYKVKEVLFEELRMTIEAQEECYRMKTSFDNIQMLLTIIETLKRVFHAEEIALVYGPY